MLSYHRVMTDKKIVKYSELSQKLDKLMVELQSGELDIDEAIDKHAEGVKLAKQMSEYLKTAKNKITKI